MRDFHIPGRSAARSTNAMVATSQPAATLAALDVLRAGGNAVDAAVAACAVLCVVEPESTGIGGDCFCLYAPAGSGKVIAMNGSGHAPAAATADWYRERGIDAIPDMTPHCVTVPGAIDAWSRLVADHGRKGLDELLQPAIRYAEQGFVVHGRVALDWAGEAAKMRKDESAARLFGTPLAEGERFVQKELGRTLRMVAEGGRDAFYTGEIADDIVGYLRSKGGLHTLDDFAAQQAEYVEPITTDYRGYTVHECPPNGVGIIALLILNILEGYEPAPGGPLSVARMHRLIEATRLAFRDRNAFVADPRMADVPMARLLDKAYAAELRGFMSDERAMADLPPAGLPPHEDTVYLCVVDEDGNACSFINSLFKAFGSGIMAPKSGVILQNRGLGFVIDPDHPNCIAPRKRPMHTIIPGMLTKGGEAVMPFGVMGGHYQPVGHAWVLTSILDYGMDPQAAIDLARLFAYEGQVEVERGIGFEACEALSRLGHKLKPIDKPHGGGQAIWIDRERGTLTGGSDPRKDGLALGY